jgi:hypothetical protein
MRDDWEWVHGTDKSVIDANADADNDGAANVVEYLRGTLPQDNSSTPAIRTIYVDASSTGGDGSVANPYASLTTAISNAQHGDTLQLATGSYYTVFSNQKSISVRGPADRSATFKAGVFIHSGALWGEFSNITLRLTGTNSLNNLRNVSLRNCVVNAAKGIMVSDSRMEITNTVIYGIGAATSTNTGITLQGTNYLAINNATLADYRVGLLRNTGTTELSLRNSILANADDLSEITDSTGVAYNLIADGGLAGSNGNFTATPVFVGVGDYHVQPESPSIDAGDPLSDYSNESENNGKRINLGAYGNTSEATVGNDSDGDGLTDQHEWCYDGNCGSYQPYDPAAGVGVDLNINSADTDADGYTDAAELKAGSSPLDADSIPAPVTIPVPVDGDVNQDGKVDAGDVLLLQRHVLGLAVLSPDGLARGDMYPPGGGDTVINVQDLILVLRAALVQ